VGYARAAALLRIGDVADVVQLLEKSTAARG
jgi:hypothetical protein